MKIIILSFLFLSLAVNCEEVVEKKSTGNTLSKIQKLKNIKRYYPKEYQNYYRGIYRRSKPHPLMAGLVISFIPSVLQSDDCIAFEYMYNKDSYGDMMKPCDTPRVEYPIDISIFSDGALKEKVGVIHFGFDEKTKKLKKEKSIIPVRNGSLKTTLNMSFTTYRDFITGYIEINGKRSCRYAPKGKHRYNVNLGDDCDVLNYFPPWFEVNVVHKDSYEIKQRDGSSIFLSKKEMKPYVYKIVKSDRDYLRDNKILTKKQLQQAGNIFEEIKVDIYKIKKDEFMSKYNLSFNGRYNKNASEKTYKVLKERLTSVLFFRDLSVIRRGPNEKYATFEKTFPSSADEEHGIYIRFKKNGKNLIYNYVGGS